MALAFHRRLDRSGPAMAFREAVLELRERFPSPVLWAGWRLFGDPGVWEAR
jgi:CHAT domain-containing protein